MLMVLIRGHPRKKSSVKPTTICFDVKPYHISSGFPIDAIIINQFSRIHIGTQYILFNKKRMMSFINVEILRNKFNDKKLISKFPHFARSVNIF